MNPAVSATPPGSGRINVMNRWCALRSDHRLISATPTGVERPRRTMDGERQVNEPVDDEPYWAERERDPAFIESLKKGT